MNAAPNPQPTGAWNAWNDFWFERRDPTLLGLIRILVGLVTLYTILVHSWTLPEFMGVNAWCDLAFRKDVAANRPIYAASLTASPLVGGDAFGPGPADASQEQWAFTYKNNFGLWPPAPHPVSQKEADFAMEFRQKYGTDFRFYGLPFPKDARERKILEDYVHKWGQPFPPPYPATDDDIVRIDEYLAQHGGDPRRLYARGSPVFSVWLDVSDPTTMNVIQAFFVFAAFCFVLGLGTRFSSAIVWFANLCYIHRNPHVLFGVDTMMNVLLLYLMIGPSGAALSLDRVIARWWTGKASLPEPRISANVAIRLMQIHLCIIYFISGISKLQGSSWWSGTAVWAVLGNYEFAPMHLEQYHGVLRFLAQYQAVFETFITSACLFTLIFEIAYPFLIWKPATRWLFLSGAVFLHGFIGLFMGLKTFSLLMLIFNMAYLKHEEISWLFGWRARNPEPERKPYRQMVRPSVETAVK